MLAVGAVGGLGRLGLVAAAVRQLFDPRSLFTAGEQGVWYDPSDLSTLFQDSAGTIPVTAVEQPIGRMLDKSGRGNHAFMATAIDRPILRQDAGGRYYLACNGANTWMQTNSIDFTATDKVTVFAALTPNAASTAMFVELGTTLSVGGMTLHSGYSTGNLSFGLNRGLISIYGHAMTVGAAQLSTGLLDYSQAAATDEIKMRSNGIAKSLSAQASNIGPAGSGTFGNYPLYLFRRAGTSFPFNGNFYGLVIRGALTSDPQTIAMERWLAPKTGVTL